MNRLAIRQLPCRTPSWVRRAAKNRIHDRRQIEMPLANSGKDPAKPAWGSEYIEPRMIARVKKGRSIAPTPLPIEPEAARV